MRAYSLSSRLMENYLRQPYPWFLNRNGAHLSKIILVEVQRVVNEAIMPVMLVLSQFALVLSLFGLLLVVEPTIALLAVVLFGGSYVLVFILARRALAQIGSVILASNGERFKSVHEAMSSIKDVKILGVEQTFLDRFRKPTGEMAMVQSRGCRHRRGAALDPAGAGARRHAGADPAPAGQPLRLAQRHRADPRASSPSPASGSFRRCR